MGATRHLWSDNTGAGLKRAWKWLPNTVMPETGHFCRAPGARPAPNARLPAKSNSHSAAQHANAIRGEFWTEWARWAGRVCRPAQRAHSYVSEVRRNCFGLYWPHAFQRVYSRHARAAQPRRI